MSTTPANTAMTPAGQRILDVASRLFYTHGIRAVGVDLIAREADVTKKTIYDRFGSKDALIEQYLATRDRMWRAAILEHISDHGQSPAEKIVAIFDSLDSWFQQHLPPRGCSFINAYAEISGTNHPGEKIIEDEKHWLRGLFLELASEAGFDAPDELATQLFMLHEGAYIAYSITGIEDAPRQARNAAAVLIGAQ
jgi:AcrR family transcriptional regulator